MKLQSKVIKGSLILCVLGGLAIALVLWHGDSNEGKTDGSCGGVVAVEGYKVYVSVGGVAVEHAGKLSTTWGTIKSK